MGGTARQFNDIYIKYKQTFKKPINNVALLIKNDFSDEEFVELFKELYPHMWIDLNKQYNYWHKKNLFIINKGKKSRYNFRKPYNFILDCSYYVRKKLRSSKREEMMPEDKERLKMEILKKSQSKLKKSQEKESNNLYLIQEISPSYEKIYIDRYFSTNNLHIKLEVIRELSKYKSKDIVSFFYKVNACTRNFHLKNESMKYIQSLNLPFVLRRKKKGKKTFIDNEVVENASSPEILMKRLYDDELEKSKKFDVFISHNSMDEKEVVKMYKLLNRKGLVAYVDWASDKFDLKRQWCNKTTSFIIKERIKQSEFVLIYFTSNILNSQWCPWEVGYADALGKKICLFDVEGIKEKPQFYEGYAQIVIEEKEIFIVDSKKKYELNGWLKV